MKLLFYIIFFLICSAVVAQRYDILIILLVISLLIMLGHKQYIKFKINDYKKRIAEIEQKKENAKPFLNINREPWYIIELIPGIKRVYAKTVANYVKKKKINDYIDFYNMCNVEPALYDLISRIITFK